MQALRQPAPVLGHSTVAHGPTEVDGAGVPVPTVAGVATKRQVKSQQIGAMTRSSKQANQHIGMLSGSDLRKSANPSDRTVLERIQRSELSSATTARSVW